VREAFPDAERRDDCFHALYEMNKVERQLEQKAYAATAIEHEEEKKLGKIRAQDKPERAEQKRRLATASKSYLKAIERYERFAAAKRKAHEAMEYIDVNSGALRTGEQTRSIIEAAAEEMQSIDYVKSKKVARYIRHLLGAFALLKDMLGEKTDELLEAAGALVEKHYRASSAIEGFNAALRPHLYVHKGVTQNFLELFRAYYNLRTRRSGRHKKVLHLINV
jgi:hypothetical protein